MYADDLACVVPNKEEASRAIDIIQSMSSSLELTLNKKKSGILILNETPPTDETINNIPYVPEYKYLGTWIKGNLDPTPHLNKHAEKANFLCRRFYYLRKQNDLKFNRNLFQIFILPEARMLGTLF